MATGGGETARAAAADKDEPARPLALPSPSVHPAPHDAEVEAQAATGWRSMQYLRKRRCVLCCGGCCVTTVVVVGLLVLVLALTVFKVKEPRLGINAVWLTAVSAGPGSGIASPVAANATLVADLSIKNPNVASFRFSQSETDVYHRGQTVSVAYAPAGRVGADRTARMNVTLDLLGDRLARATNGTGLLFGQDFDLDTYTEINGTVKVLGIYKRDVEIRMNCSMVIHIGGVVGVLVSGAGGAPGVQSKGLNCVADVSM
ncbi:hypothetical protein ACP4OV_020321 [Aristida adscensionis]